MTKNQGRSVNVKTGATALAVLTLLVLAFVFFSRATDEPPVVVQASPPTMAPGVEASQPESVPAIDVRDTAPIETKKARASETAEPARLRKLRQGVMRIVETDYLRQNVRSFIDEHGMENLELEQKIALGKTLQLCGFSPIMNADALALLKSELAVSGQDLGETERTCKGVTEEEIYASYGLLEEAAATGDFYAIHMYEEALPPEFLRVRMYDEPHLAPEKQKQINEKYAPAINAMLDAAIDQGSVRAALDMANRYDVGKGQPRDPVKALAYYKAVELVQAGPSYQPYIEFLSSQLFLHEIESADRQAEAIVRKWEQVGNLSY